MSFAVAYSGMSQSIQLSSPSLKPRFSGNGSDNVPTDVEANHIVNNAAKGPSVKQICKWVGAFVGTAIVVVAPTIGGLYGAKKGPFAPHNSSNPTPTSNPDNFRMNGYSFNSTEPDYTCVLDKDGRLSVVDPNLQPLHNLNLDGYHENVFPNGSIYSPRGFEVGHQSNDNYFISGDDKPAIIQKLKSENGKTQRTAIDGNITDSSTFHAGRASFEEPSGSATLQQKAALSRCFMLGNTALTEDFPHEIFKGYGSDTWKFNPLYSCHLRDDGKFDVQYPNGTLSPYNNAKITTDGKLTHPNGTQGGRQVGEYFYPAGVEATPGNALTHISKQLEGPSDNRSFAMSQEPSALKVSYALSTDIPAGLQPQKDAALAACALASNDVLNTFGVYKRDAHSSTPEASTEQIANSLRERFTTEESPVSAMKEVMQGRIPRNANTIANRAGQAVRSSFRA